MNFSFVLRIYSLRLPRCNVKQRLFLTIFYLCVCSSFTASVPCIDRAQSTKHISFPLLFSYLYFLFSSLYFLLSYMYFLFPCCICHFLICICHLSTKNTSLSLKYFTICISSFPICGSFFPICIYYFHIISFVNQEHILFPL